MKKVLLLYLSINLFLITSCEEAKPKEDTPLEHKAESLIHNIEEGDLEFLVIEDCEYIAFKDGRGSNHGFGYLAHKGNCKNPIHCHNQEVKVDSTSELKTKTKE